MERTEKIGLFPGTFDPITNGHLDVIERGRMLFDKLVVAVGHNPTKNELFTVEERHEMITELVKDWPQVTVATYEGLTVNYAQEIEATAILRGLRNVSDLNYEFQLALTNRAIADIETVFIMTGHSHAFTSSSLIRQIAAGGAIERLHRLLPPLVIDAMIARQERLNKLLGKMRTDGLKEER